MRGTRAWTFGARVALLAGLLFFVSLVRAPCAWGQSRADLEKARAAYFARNYGEAEERLRVLTDPKTGFHERLLLSQARMFLGGALLAQGKQDDAQHVFETLILEEPTFEPDPLSFPGEVINTFIDVRATLQERLRQAAANAARLEAERKLRIEAERARQEAWFAEVKRMASEEKVTVRNQRIVAFVPFGAGQFQNRQPLLGWVFLSTQVALAAATAVTVPMRAYAASRANEENMNGDVHRTAALYKAREDNIRIVNLSLAGAFAAVAIAGVVQANLAFVDEFVETKKRPLPVAKVGPTVAPLTRPDGALAGASVGLQGVFF